ncbi:SCC4 (YER147C) [Zygosaccharomyces parabailii]|nr:SCC4 (YER147C) [Zygosaccharomyces parabailii]
MSTSKLSPDVIYHLAHEYENQAYTNACHVASEAELKQYYTLIMMAIKALEYIKGHYALSMEQDFQVTVELAILLMKETHNLDLAESYLSSLRERLKNHRVTAATELLFKESMHCEFLSLYELPLRRNSKFHYQIALKNCDKLLQSFGDVIDAAKGNYEVWRSVFAFVHVNLNAKLGKRSRAIAGFEILTSEISGSSQWQAFVTLCHVSYLLSYRKTIPLSISENLQGITIDIAGPKLYCWTMVLQLFIQVFEDKNITSNLNQFKHFFSQHKTSLLDDDGSCTIELGQGINLMVSLPHIFRYRDLKNVLLLLQSVSFLVNCHDKKANFSTRFLPKVCSATRKLIESSSDLCHWSLSDHDDELGSYYHILDCAEFYQNWETFLLTQRLKPLEKNNNRISKLYSALVEAMGQQAKGNVTTENYDKIIKSKVVNEVKLIALVNCFVLKASEVSKGIGREDNMAYCNSLWTQMENILRETDLWKNQMWGCTMTLLWLVSHLEPFTSNPMPSTDEEKSQYLGLLRNYYNVNKIVKDETKDSAYDNGALKLKRSILLQILLNYLGGRLLEQDLTIICQVSGICFRLARQQNSLNLQYVIGIWHLLNSTVAMNNKEVTIMRSKLSGIVKDILNKEG